MKNNKDDNKALVKMDKSLPPKREQLVKELEEYKSNINQELSSMKSTVFSALIGVGTAYISYRVVRYLTKSSKPSKRKDERQKEIIIYQPEKKSSSVWDLIQREVAYIFIDALKDVAKNTFLGKKAKEKDAEAE